MLESTVKDCTIAMTAGFTTSRKFIKMVDKHNLDFVKIVKSARKVSS